MNSTTGELATARSIACRTSSERRRICVGVRKRCARRAREEGRMRVVRLAARDAFAIC
jgi:hypothetical protein